MRHDTGQPEAEPQAALDLAASWYVGLPSGDLTRRPAPLTLFGRKLVAWRAGDGRPVLMARACPHMGASLAHGKLVDGLLECPFHGWRFDGSGACVAIQGSDRIPAAAHRQTYPTAERYGYVWAWYGSAEPMFALPQLPALEAGHGRNRRFRYADTTTTSVRQILENTYDPGHLAGLHGLRAGEPLRSRLLTPAELGGDHGPSIPAEACLGSELRWSGRVGALGTISRLTGTGARQFTLRADGWPAGRRLSLLADGVPRYRMLLATTPVAPGHSVRHIAVAVEGTGRIRTDLLHLLVNRIGVTSRRDRPILNAVRSGDREGDDGVQLFRRHYQSWVDRVAHVDGDPAARPGRGATSG